MDKKYRQEKLIEQVKIYRNPETQTKEDAMDDFLFYVDRDCELDIPTEIRDYLQDLVNRYLAYDIEKVKQGELELLAKWTASNG